MSKFIVLEGIEGSGKTTLVSQIEKILRDYGIKDIIVTREPGGTPISEIFRSLIKIGKDGGDMPISAHSELLIFYAARIQLLENIIRPALSKGIWVIGDRHDFSSQAYQGGGRGIDKSFIKYLSQVLLKNFHPDITFYLDVPPDVGFSRIKNMRKLDYIERESIDFFTRVRSFYQSLARENENIITIDATQSLAQVTDDIRQYLRNLLNI